MTLPIAAGIFQLPGLGMHVEYLSYGHPMLCIGYQVLQPQRITTQPKEKI